MQGKSFQRRREEERQIRLRERPRNRHQETANAEGVRQLQDPIPREAAAQRSDARHRLHQSTELDQSFAEHGSGTCDHFVVNDLLIVSPSAALIRLRVVRA